MTNYKDLGLKCGLEIHIQLDTKHKLFCKCSTKMEEKKPKKIIVRKLHPVASELGEVDVAAQYEYLKGRTFYYYVFENESCLVETDSEPPHEVNKEALELAIKIALLLNCKIPHEIHVMRKTVIDGSNTSGFQRTMIVGKDGFVEFNGRKIKIETVCLEEDAAAIVKEENNKVFYRLNRLGIPLVEIATQTLEGFSPQQIQEIAYKIGLIAKSTGKIKRGIGSIRQDINVSIKEGNRVEIKGVQQLELLAKVIEKEVQRQLEIIKKGGKVEKETRAANPDGTTRFMRPLPGAARMYPETDIPPITISRQFLARLKKELPETLDKKIERFVSMGLSKEIAVQIIRSNYLAVFEHLTQNLKVDAKLAARVLINLMKDLKRKGFDVSKIGEKHLIEMFKLYKKEIIAKEAMEEILKEICKGKQKVREIVKEKNLFLLKDDELEKIIRTEVKANEQMPLNKIFGIIMSKVRGRAKPEKVKLILNKVLKELAN